MKELTASEITRRAIQILDSRNIEAWRQANYTYGKRKGVATKGISDILGFERSSGKLYAVEVKKIGDTMKPDQHVFLTKVKLSGAIALIAVQKGDDVILNEY